jgi:hypothetical protein
MGRRTGVDTAHLLEVNRGLHEIAQNARIGKEKPTNRIDVLTDPPDFDFAFLRLGGLVTQHGRSGDSKPNPMTLATAANAAWGGVAGRSGVQINGEGA